MAQPDDGGGDLLKAVITLVTGGGILKAWQVFRGWRRERADEDAKLAELKRQVEADLWTRTQGDIKRLEHRTASLEARNAALEARVEDLEDALERAQSELAARENELAQARSEVERLMMLTTEQAGRISELETKVSVQKQAVLELEELLRIARNGGVRRDEI